MTNIKQKQDVDVGGARAWRLVPAIAEIAFLLTGVFLTLAAYLFINLSVGDMVRGEYDRMMQGTVTSLASSFTDLERSVNTTAAIFENAPAGNEESLFTKMIDLDEGMRHFDQVLYLYKNEAGEWEYKSFYNASESLYAVKPDKGLVAETHNFKSDAPVRVLTNPDLFQVKTGSMNDLRAKPFALARLVQKDGVVQGMLVAVGNAGTLLDKEWQETHAQIIKLGIRDLDSDYDLFLLDRANGQKAQGTERTYEFMFGGHRWEVRTQSAVEEKIFLLTAIPYFVIVFGFILTTAGTLYIHGTQRQAQRVSSINNALEQKNRELEQEIAKRERLNIALKRSESENRAVIDSVSDVIFELNPEGKILFLNATWKKVTGFEAKQSKGMDIFNMLHPQDQDRQRKDFQALVQGQKETYRALTRLRTADGSFHAVEISFSMLRKDEQNNVRVVGALTDVEERRRAERALVETEKKYRAIVENAAGGIFQLTPEGVYLSVNPAMARILGYSSMDDLMQNVRNANEDVYFNGRERLYFLKELEKEGVIHNYETQVIRKDGSRIWVNENIRAVRDGGTTLYYEGSLEDISQRKQAEIGLRETKIASDLANRAKSEFLANMSHELRTPLNSIIGFSEIIHNETFGPLGQAAYKEYANDIYQSGKKLLSVINEILDISKIEAGERHLNDQIVDLEALVKGCLKMVENKVRANNLIVSNQLSNVPQVVGEELAIKQVFINLLSNAIKFTPSGGRVSITSDRDAHGNLNIAITDTGIGLDEGEIDKALSPFGQIHNEFNRSNAGTGLGLTLAHALVKLHDGKLELFSQKGIGTTVTIVFPADRLAPEKATASAKKESITKE